MLRSSVLSVETECSAKTAQLFPLPFVSSPQVWDAVGTHAVRGHCSHPRQGPAKTLTIKAQQLASENLHADLYDLNQVHSVLSRDQHRTSKGLRDQFLTPNMKLGLEIAVRRSLACLVHDYELEYKAWVKQKARCRAVERGELPATSEDVELERRHEGCH